MIIEFGHYALILALCLAVIQASIPLLSVHYQWLPGMNLARPLSYGQFGLISFSLAVLAYAFVSNDFSVAYVASNSHTQLPLFYRFCATWGAHEGSLLLWAFILSAWMAMVAFKSHQLPLPFVARVLGILSGVSTGFLLFLLSTSNPFLRLLSHVPSNGLDLNPLLQDPGLATHPPILYMGYVGFAVPFAFALAALLQGQLDEKWARWCRPWTLVAWSFLTLGIVLGSWWAYRELGWGGWWFWDPVENASLLPWLAGTALIHSLLGASKQNAYKAWTVLLAILAFSLSLLGTFLVRSGVLISVHSFAIDPARGAFMLVFLGIVVGISLLIYACRAHKLVSHPQFEVLSKESLLLFNNILLVGVLFSILLGTVYPMVIDSLGLEKISVGAPYFNVVFIPFMFCILILMGLMPLTHWGRQVQWRSLLHRSCWILLVCVVLAGLLPYGITGSVSMGVVLGVGLSLFIVVTTVQSVFQRRGAWLVLKPLRLRHWGMVSAHLGVAVCTLGVVLVSHYSIQREVRMISGDEIHLGKYTFQFLGVQNLQGANYQGNRGGVLVKEGGKVLTLLQPELRVYPISHMALGKTAIDANLTRDLYVALGEPLGQGWSLRIYKKPFVRWIWAGGCLMMLGGFLALFDRRFSSSVVRS